MLPHPTSRSASTSAPGANAPPPPSPPLPDLALLLEQHVVAGFPSDLALDLVLNELVARAADATHASAAALALLRGKLMVCRAATGFHAPDLGIPLDTRDGLSGACARSRSPQVSDDTESDPRVDPAISRRLGIRSMLVVPVFAYKKTATERNPPLTGVLEVFSPLPNSFTQQAQILLADFADECARIHNMATQLQSRPRTEIVQPHDDLILSDTDAMKSERRRVTETMPETASWDPASDDLGTGNLATDPDDATSDAGSVDSSPPVVRAAVKPMPISDRSWSMKSWPRKLPDPESLPSSDPAITANRRLLPAPLRQPYEIWTLVLGGLVILAAAAFSFMIGSRVGWLRPQQPPSAIAAQQLKASMFFSPQQTVHHRREGRRNHSAHGKNSERSSAVPQNEDSSKSKSHNNLRAPPTNSSSTTMAKSFFA